jgi:hypothetical protein
MKAAVLKWQKQVDPFAGHGQLQEEHPSSKIGHSSYRLYSPCGD